MNAFLHYFGTNVNNKFSNMEMKSNKTQLVLIREEQKIMFQGCILSLSHCNFHNNRRKSSFIIAKTHALHKKGAHIQKKGKTFNLQCFSD